MEEELTIDQRRCAYEPAVLAGRAGATLAIRNSDALIHNTRADQGAATLFNVATPLEGMTTRKSLPALPGVVALRCDVHPWMRAHVALFDHPWFAVAGAGGRYRISNVPSGKHQVRFWHPRLGEQAREIEVPAGRAAVLNLEWRATE